MLLQSFFVINLLTFIAFAESENCEISITTDIGFPQPLLLNPNNKNKILEPSQDGLITLNDGEYIGIGCPGSSILINSGSIGFEFTKALCKNGKFIIEGGSISIFERITCEKSITATTTVNVNQTCSKTSPVKHKQISIGFQFEKEPKSFLKLITICFNIETEYTVYSTFKLSQSNLIRQLNVARPSWTAGTDYDPQISFNNLYSRTGQRKIINKLVGLLDDDLRYIDDKDFYLNRGHLTAMADFIYASQQKATFFYVNSAPQWATFNGGNWKRLEEEIRDFSANNKIDLNVYTGTYETLTLPDVNNLNQIEIYLYRLQRDNNNNNISSSNNNKATEIKKIPVPKMFWKVIHDPNQNTSLAFIGINNPYIELSGNENKTIFCKDICDDVKFAQFDRKNITSGYVFCCDVEEFKKTVVNLPDFEVKGLLTNGSKGLSSITTGFLVLIVSFVIVTL